MSLADTPTSPAWIMRLKRTHWSNKLLVCVLGIALASITIAGVWIAALPTVFTAPKPLPQFASAQTGEKRFPINLPEPAAGQSTVTFPITLPPNAPPGKQEPDGQTSQAAAPATSPRLEATQKPRSLLASLITDEDGHTLPVVAADGTTSFEAYSAPLSLSDGDERARIALIFTGIGLNSARSNNVMESLPPDVTIAISPYAQTPQKWADEALAQGRDSLMMVPMEPNSFPTIDPGPDTLLRDAPTIQTLQRLHTVLGKAQGYVGIINDTGSRFTANEVALGPVLDDIAKRGIMVVDARASAYSVMASQAKKRRIPVAVNTRFVDSSLTPTDIDRQLRDLERTAQTIGAAVGVMRDFPITIERVQAWRKTLDLEEFVLVPISAVANRQPIR